MGNKLNVKLIALDLDDTLLDDNREIDDGNVEVLRKCSEKGIYIVLCSGRAEDAILPFVRRIEIAGEEGGRYIIAINGCSVYDMHKRRQIFCRKVEPEISKNCLKSLLQKCLFRANLLFCLNFRMY